jgi:DNA primase
MYAYKIDDKFKIYRPFNTKYTKWRANVTTENIQGLKQLPKGQRNLLIITKSLKDVMVLYKMGYDAVSPSSETTFLPTKILDKLKKKYKHILILYDRDRTGMLKARTYSKEYGLDAFFVNKKFNSKDISDAVANCGFDAVKEWLDKTLNKYERN